MLPHQPVRSNAIVLSIKPHIECIKESRISTFFDDGFLNALAIHFVEDRPWRITGADVKHTMVCEQAILVQFNCRVIRLDQFTAAV